ncbi:zonadhesin-like isoform X3 [Glandiceps talaboti]
MGQIYKRGTTFTPYGCEEVCDCTADGKMNCSLLECDDNAYCGYDDGDNYECHCYDGYTGDGLTCTLQYAECRAWGDPHYVTFDDLKYNYQGTCKYVLVTSNCTEPLYKPYFYIVAQNQKNSPSDTVTYTREVYIDVGGEGYELLQGGVVHVDGSTVTLPYRNINASVIIKRAGSSVKLVADFGLVVIWDTKNSVAVHVPYTYWNGTCGLCGTLDGDKTNDLKSPDGTQIDDTVVFGDSWVANPVDCDGVTADPDPCAELPDEVITKIEEACGILKDQSGPFAGCHESVDQEVFYETCVYDTCAIPGNGSLCDNLENFAGKCVQNGGELEDWRSEDLCPMDCVSPAVYRQSTSACPATCVDPDAERSCSERPVEGCECSGGTVLDGNVCVHIDECGCRYKGQIYKRGMTFIPYGCEEVCNCTVNGVINCTPQTCDNNAYCEHDGDDYGCHCDDSYTGDGLTCTLDCDSLTDPANGVLSTTDVTSGTSVEITCNTGYSLSGISPITCTNGVWSGPVPSCPADCDTLTDPANGVFLTTDVTSGTSVEITCNTGYSLSGISPITCNDGDWSGPVPSCPADCDSLTDPANGVFSTTDVTSGTSVEITCNTGYSLSGISPITCTNGVWSGPVPSCPADCDSLTEPANGVFQLLTSQVVQV